MVGKGDVPAAPFPQGVEESKVPMLLQLVERSSCRIEQFQVGGARLVFQGVSSAPFSASDRIRRRCRSVRFSVLSNQFPRIGCNSRYMSARPHPDLYLQSAILMTPS